MAIRHEVVGFLRETELHDLPDALFDFVLDAEETGELMDPES